MVAQFGGVLVIFLIDCRAQFVLEFFALGHRLFLGGLFLDILEPFAKGVNLHAAVDQFLAAHLGVEQVQLLDGSDDFRDGGLVVPIGEKFCPDGANLHHDRLRSELLEALADIILRGEVLHEVEQLKDVLGVALDGLEAKGGRLVASWVSP